MALAGAFLALRCGAPASAPPSPSPSPVAAAGSAGPAATPSAASPDPKRLAGQWMRTDSDYMIWIEGVSADGRMEARYLNPRPIHVARAEVKRDEGRLRLLVELQDQGYPGSYYTLTYDPGGDALYGVYHHLGLNQNYDVSFYRFDAPGKPGPRSR
jgi:hypothetical protein